MKPYLLAVVILLTIAVLAACGRTPAQTAEQTTTQTAEQAAIKTTVQAAKAPAASGASDPRQFAEDSLAFLQTNIDNPTSFSAITDAFAALCAEPTADELVLFEVGTFTFDGKTKFTIALVRQIPDGNDEFYQVRAELSFEPNEENSKIQETTWIDPTDADAFAAVRGSDAFAYAASHAPVSVDMYIGET